ncbi:MULTISPECIES: NDxxF motif lipoprotein [Staphylococcus]|uniref:NDxxF motif lipoprotein n=2 Tax=Staphylococcus TaxID=1279 RepID=UPI000267E141|nr:NDxxF motif lipoprotein [Staphylococcus equorum]MCE5048464.1 NDxxF motif lipoprotein [Staphylococcus equorum]MCM3072574.1 NDxxF motif lipoprotein [Staphylococcus equorum]MDK9846712.1 NDxxF motif lipoprotein [Staphylococcus equorum]MDK9848136.1 NDxxF motif lipoprotein [Staphylococcus equorum]MDK9852352.1 NDxxF motif lipoprotein [Staphylococcus equorum]
MKIIKYISLITLALLLVACSKGESENKSSDQEAKATEIPKKVFSSQKSDEKISEDEMGSSIKKYLDTFDALDENTSKIRDKDELNEKDQNKLNKLTKLTNKNDKNFKQFIENNQLPKQYEKGSLKVSDYVTSVNELMNKINDKVDATMDDSNTDQTKLKNVGEIKEINAQYKKQVNGKKQKEVEQFLNKHDIQTKAFE